MSMIFNNLGNVIVDDRIITAKELRKGINKIKANLNKYIEHNSIVGILGYRNEETIMVILACLESNITFIPIDVKMPMERTIYMLNNSGARYLLNGTSDLILTQENKWENIPYKILFEMPQEIEINDENEENPAYILYTSGTSGRPKGVIISCLGFNNFLNAIPERIIFAKGSSISGFTSFSFDISLMEIVLGLKNGVNLILANDEERNNPSKIISLIKKYSINMIQVTPSMLKMLQVVNGGKLDFLEKVDILMVGGEKFPNDLLNAIKRDSNCKIYNMYGPTETTIWSTISELTQKESCDIGVPITGTTVYIVDDENNLVDKGEEGELLIGGDGLAEGYINESDLTNEKFIILPFGKRERVYKTGDICKYGDNGELIYISRKDSQIKYNGHRIELEEIEYWINQTQKVKNNCVCFDGNKLICFYLSADNEAIVVDRKRLKTYLPDYMIPSCYQLVDDFEYTISKKVDRKRMIDKYNDIIATSKCGGVDDGIVSDIETKVRQLISEMLNLSFDEVQLEFAINDSGIDSIQFVKMIVELESYFNIEFEDDFLNIEKFSTINELAEYIENIKI